MSLLAMLNPIHHTATPEAVARYAVEPYALAADVYAAPGHVGRGGWTWYTGAAGWMYRIALEDVLGVHLDGGRLAFAPSVPSAWRHYEITYRHASSSFHIVVENALGAAKGGYRVELDGEVVADGMIPLSDDAKIHEVRVIAIPSAPRHMPEIVEHRPSGGAGS